MGDKDGRDVDVQIAEEIAREAIEYLRALLAAGKGTDEKPRDVALYEVTETLKFVGRTTVRLRDRFPAGMMPGMALRSLALELFDLNGGGGGGPITSRDAERSRANTPDRTGIKRGRRPPVPTKTRNLRAEVVACVELICRDGLSVQDARMEAAKALMGHPILFDVKGDVRRAIRRWRSDTMADAGAFDHYKGFLIVAEREVVARGGTSAEFRSLALHRLKNLERP